MAIDPKILQQILAKGGEKGGWLEKLGSLLSAGGEGGSTTSPPPDAGKSKSKSMSDLFSRLRSTSGNEGAELTPESPPPSPPKKKQKSFGEYIAAPFDYARGGLEALGDPEKGMIRTGQNRGGFLGGAQATAGYGVKALQNQSAAGSMGDLMGGAGEAAGHIPVVGKPMAAFFKLGETVFKSVDRLKQWNEQLLQGNLRFAEFSGAMASVAAEQKIRDITLSQERGDRRAATAGFQAEEKFNFERRFAKYEDLVDSVKNVIGGGIAKLEDTILKSVEKFTGLDKGIEKLQGLLDDLVGPGEGGHVEDWLRRGAPMNTVNEAYKRYGRPARFP